MKKPATIESYLFLYKKEWIFVSLYNFLIVSLYVYTSLMLLRDVFESNAKTMTYFKTCQESTMEFSLRKSQCLMKRFVNIVNG